MLYKSNETHCYASMSLWLASLFLTQAPYNVPSEVDIEWLPFGCSKPYWNWHVQVQTGRDMQLTRNSQPQPPQATAQGPPTPSLRTPAPPLGKSPSATMAPPMHPSWMGQQGPGQLQPRPSMLPCWLALPGSGLPPRLHQTSGLLRPGARSSPQLHQKQPPWMTSQGCLSPSLYPTASQQGRTACVKLRPPPWKALQDDIFDGTSTCPLPESWSSCGF